MPLATLALGLGGATAILIYFRTDPQLRREWQTIAVVLLGHVWLLVLSATILLQPRTLPLVAFSVVVTLIVLYMVYEARGG